MNKVVSLLVLLATGAVLARRAHTPSPAPLDGPALVMGQPLDLDTATIAELDALPGIGPSLAGRIVEARPFADVHDLQRVRGIGPVTVQRLEPFVE